MILCVAPPHYLYVRTHNELQQKNDDAWIALQTLEERRHPAKNSKSANNHKKKLLFFFLYPPAIAVMPLFCYHHNIALLDHVIGRILHMLEGFRERCRQTHRQQQRESKMHKIDMEQK